jgi:hypothetical protein
MSLSVRSGTRRTLAVVVATVLVVVGCEHVPVPGAPGCRLTPSNNYWRADVRGLPVHHRSAAYINNIGPTKSLKADFGSGLWDGGPIGIPYVVVPGSQPKVPITFEYWDESDPGPYPIPPNAPIEGGPDSDGDRHILVVDKDNCVYYETYSSYPDAEGGWEAGSGAIWDMRSNELHPDTWTSADAAGLPILPGLVRYDEVAAGKVLHAIRITVPVTQHAYVWPARHRAGSTTNLDYPPMGTWFRLKGSIDPNTFDPMVRPIVVALQTYGAIVADNGSAWYMSGVPDERWDNDQLRDLARIKGSDFQVVDTTSLIVSPDSGQATTAH